MLSSRSLKLVGPFCVMALLVAGCDRQSQTPTQPDLHAGASSASPEAEPGGVFDTSHKGEPLPAVTVSDPTGRKLDLASLKGKPVLINLWATWCGPCVAELPTLAKLAKAKAGALQVVTVSQDMKTDRVGEFLKQKAGDDLPAWLDPETGLSSKYLLESLPTSVLYDASGKEVWRLIGPMNWEGADAAKRLAEGGVS